MTSGELAMPMWALTLAYWLHMLATVVWIGGLTSMVLFVLPAAQSSLGPQEYAGFLDRVTRKLDPLGWLSLTVLVGTGLFQMSASPNYAGFLVIGNRWAVAIFIKHLVFGAMIAVSAYLTWGVLPALRRLALRRAAGQDTLGSRQIGPARNPIAALEPDPGGPGLGPDCPGQGLVTKTNSQHSMGRKFPS